MFRRSQKSSPHLSKICFFLLYRILCSSCTHHNISPPFKTTFTSYHEYEEEYQHEHRRRAIIDKYYRKPTLKWTHQLGHGKIHSSHSLRRGNGIIVSEDNDQLFITTDDGTLHILHAHHPSTSRKFVPSLGEKHNRKAWYTFCQSMVSLRHTEERIPRVTFGVYAVVDVPPPKSLERERSRIIAVNHLAQQLWSTIIPGVAVGTPVISPGGKYIYVTHNVHDEMVGYVTILSVEQNGRMVRSERNKNGDVPFGALSSIVRYGDKDVLYFGESPGRGFHEEGIMHKLIVGDGDSESGGLSFEWELLRQTRWSVGVAAPTVSKNGRKLWISGTGGWMRGVTGDLNLSHQMLWKTDLDASSRNRTQPLYNQAVLSSDEQFLYVASSGTSFYCLKSDTGEVIWKNPEEGHSVYLTQAKLSYDNTKLFTIAHSDGTVTQQDTQTGKIKWQFNCASTSSDPNCADSVEAEFSLSPDGSTIYYGDIFGKITALVIGSTPAPTPFPSASPTSSQQPTQRPTNYPTLFPTKEPTPFPSIYPTNHPTLNPTANPSSPPTHDPTNSPTPSPSSSPTLSPTNRPSTKPTLAPTMNPTITNNPTVSPTMTTSPSNDPTLSFQPSLSELPSQPPTNDIYKETGVGAAGGMTWGRGVLFLGVFCLGVIITMICLVAGIKSGWCGRNERRKVIV